MALRVGIGLPFVDVDGNPHDAGSLGKRAEWIEDAGFSGIWMGDASFRNLATWPDPFLWMLGAAAATARVELGYAVYQVPLRNPVDIAQRILTLKELSNNRLTVGVGPGSTENAFDAVGEPFEGRFRRLHESMATIRILCEGGSAGNSDLGPPPGIVGSPRFLLGAWHGGANLKRAALEYDGWLCSAARTTAGTMVDGLARYRDLGGGRAVVASCGADFAASRRPWGPEDPFNLYCDPLEAADRLAWIEEQGFDDIMINVRNVGEGKGLFDNDLDHDKLLQLRAVWEPAPALIEAVR